MNIDAVSNTVTVRPTNMQQHLGSIVFRIRACLKNSEFYEDINCVYSEPISVLVEDPCMNTYLAGYGLSRPLAAKLDKGDQYVIPGPYDFADLQSQQYGLGKCGEIVCGAYLLDHVTMPSWLTVNNNVYNSIDNTYNTQLVLKPISGRDNTGEYAVYIDCEFIEYPDLGVFSSQIQVEILEPSNCQPGEGGTNDSSCSDSSEEVMSDDDLGNGVSADDSSNDGYSGNDMNSSDSSNDGPSIGDNFSSDTTGDGVSDDLGRRRLADDSGFPDVPMNVELAQVSAKEERAPRTTRRTHHGKVPRSFSADEGRLAREDLTKMHKRDSRDLQSSPQMIQVEKHADRKDITMKCPVGQYLPKDSE